jgi:TPP-dependent pyruvate/acetoin dehydrogenase alpha subunit
VVQRRRTGSGLVLRHITDLANDTTGEYRTSREQTSQRTGEPLEGLQLAIVGRYMLSEKKAGDFRRH